MQSSDTYMAYVDGVYVKEGKILLLKRSVEPFKGFWHVVGGRVEEDETLKNALQREFKEETGLDVIVGKMLGGRIEKTSDRTKIIMAFEVLQAKGEIKLNDEHSEYAWFSEMPHRCVFNYLKCLKRLRA